MLIPEFEMERFQSLHENEVNINLSESGVHPFSINQILTNNQIEEMLNIPLTYGFTHGTPQLREAIATLYKMASPENVLVTNGSAEANFLACLTLLERNDEIIMILPNYMQIHGIAQTLGVQINEVWLQEEKGWKPDIEDIEKAVTAKTKMLVICHPNNPTGSRLSEEEMAPIIALANRHNMLIYADEVYRGAEFDGEETKSFYDYCDNAIVTGGLSKAYAMPGLRLGWLVGPPKFIEQAWGTHDYTSIAAGVLSNRIAAVALQPEKREEILARNRNFLRKNLQILQGWLSDRADQFSFVPPEAGGIAYLKMLKPYSSAKLARELLEQESTLVVAGSWFKMDNFIRLGIGIPAEEFKKGLTLLGNYCDKYF